MNKKKHGTAAAACSTKGNIAVTDGFVRFKSCRAQSVESKKL